MTFTENMLSQYGGTTQAKQNTEGVCDNNFDTMMANNFLSSLC